MTANHHIRRETLVSVIINSTLSLLFFLLVFGMRDPVPVWGIGQWVFDFVPQGFMIALMSTLVPGALAARKVKAGTVQTIDHNSRLPRSLVPRALVLAVASAVVGTAIIALIAWLAGLQSIPHVAALLLKVCYGALLSIIVTPPALRAALAG